MFQQTHILVLGLLVWTVAGARDCASAVNPHALPWEPSYKIKPSETHRLTLADVVGPDGIVYPNWTKCGVQGGIPSVKVAATIEEFGGKANDDGDDSRALDEGCAAVGKRGGGALLLGEGTYYLDRPVTIRHSGVVIRGRGADKTRIIFRYALPASGIGFYWPPANGRVGPETPIELHARPTDLQKMTVYVDNTAVGTWSRSQHSGNTFDFTVRLGRGLAGIPAGAHTLKGVAEYGNKSILTTEIPITFDPSLRNEPPVPSTEAAITFLGERTSAPELQLARDGKRGDTVLTLKSARGLRAGDCIFIEGPATERWKKLTQCACPWGIYRQYMAVVEKVEGNVITLNQPLRIEFPVIDGSYVQKINPIRNCGIEDLYIEQTENLWISSVIFQHAWNCWARGVTVKKCGRHPVYALSAKWCEIRDCTFDDAWFKGGGGTAYTGWQSSFDCLMENVVTHKMRHAPLYQWAASGCVIRKSVFHESDGQWHAGWTNENLFEQCVIESVQGHGGYGYGMWASPPSDKAHGPNGPRNVVYNCDVSSPRAGLKMGGMNENWLILYNRFVVGDEQGVFVGTTSFDHIIRGNVFVLKDGKSPMVFLSQPSCVGVEIVGNRLYGGNGQFVAGKAKAAVMEGNQAFPLGEAPRPQPPVPSIYAWQKERAKQK